MTTALAITYRKTAELVPYDRNARTHTAEQIEQIAAAIREFGWTNPVLVDEHSRLIAGHGRLAAALALGMAEVPTICLPGLSDAQRRALIIADNKLALNAGWDDALLASELELLRVEDFDLGIVGFTAEELNQLLPQQFEPATQTDQSRLDEKAKHVCPNCGHEF